MSQTHVQMNRPEQAAYTLARQSFARGEDDTALQAVRTLLRTQDGFADVHYMLGILSERRGDLSAAETALQEAVRINPSYAEALLALATLHERRGNYDLARECAERATTAHSPGAPAGGVDATTRGKLANMQAAVGDACVEAGDFREAIFAYRKALDRCPDFHDIRHRLGIALREAGLGNKATLEFQRVLRSNPGFLESRVQLGLTYYTLGRRKDATEEWNETEYVFEDELVLITREGSNVTCIAKD